MLSALCGRHFRSSSAFCSLTASQRSGLPSSAAHVDAPSPLRPGRRALGQYIDEDYLADVALASFQSFTLLPLGSLSFFFSQIFLYLLRCRVKTEEKVWITLQMLRLALPSAKKVVLFLSFFPLLVPFFSCICAKSAREYVP